jgi:hypothetical protein
MSAACAASSSSTPFQIEEMLLSYVLLRHAGIKACSIVSCKRHAVVLQALRSAVQAL